MTIEVLDPGPLTTVQDRGRVGWAHLGVPRGGALDRAAAALANRLVGNDPDAAVLETTLGGVALRTGAAMTIAVTGATCDVRVGSRPASYGLPVTVRAGTTVTVGAARDGVRSYVAVAGGIDVEPVLGSRSTDTLAWIGPPRLRAGHRLRVGATRGRQVPVDVAPLVPRPAVLTLRRGPRADWLAERAWDALDGAPYLVGPDSDRVGLRLSGPELARSRTGEMASEGMVLGAVQLPPSGQPIVFLADHPTTGGYPVVAIADEDGLDACAQWRPGTRVTLRVR